MTTVKQIAANRRNAQQSTGPTTPAGRERSKMNAWKHGLTASQITANEQEARDFEAFRDDWFEALAPVGAVEQQLVEEIAIYSWRLRRVPRLEVTETEYHQESPLGVKVL